VSKPVCILSADWHAADLSWSDRPSIQGDTWHCIERLINYSAKYQLPIIACGDLINVRRPTSSTMTALSNLLKRTDASIYYIQGQHELATGSLWLPETKLPDTLAEADSPWLSALGAENVIYLHDSGVVLHSGGQQFWFTAFDWQSAQELPKRLDVCLPESAPEAVHVLVLHQTAETFMGDLVECELKNGMIPDFFRLVVIGDYHKRRISTIQRKDGVEIPIVSPGSLRPTTIDDTEPKGFYVLHDDGAVMPVDIPQRRIFNIVAADTNEETIAELRAAKQAAENTVIEGPYAELVSKPAARVIFNELIEGAETEIKEAPCGEKRMSEAFHLLFTYRQGVQENEETEVVSGDCTADAALEEWFCDDAFCAEFARHLMASQGLTATIQDFRKKFIEERLTNV